LLVDSKYRKHEKERRKKEYANLTYRQLEDRKEESRKAKIELKFQVLSHYSPNKKLRCSWRNCKISDIDMLSLDHIKNDGAKDRTGIALYRSLRKENFPSGYQTLCANHNQKKEILRVRGLL